MVIDAILAIIAIWGFYIGFSRGIIKTFFTVVSYAFGVMAIIKFGRPATNFLKEIFNTDEAYMFIAGYLLAFFLTMLIIRLIGRSLEGILETAQINIVNQVAGGALFAALNVFIYSVILTFGYNAKVVTQEAVDKSSTYVYLEKFPEKVYRAWDTVSPTFKQFWDNSVEDMDRLKEKMDVKRTDSEPVIRDFDDEPTSNRGT